MQQERALLAIIFLSAAAYATHSEWSSISPMLASSAGWSKLIKPAFADSQSSQHSSLTSSQVVQAYYNAINNGRFEDAYRMLSPKSKAKASLQSFRDGYSTTKSVSADVTPSTARIVKTTLHAVDVTHGGDLARTFTGEMTLERTGTSWSIDSGSFQLASRPTSAPEPAAASAASTDQSTASDSGSESRAPVGITVDDSPMLTCARARSNPALASETCHTARVFYDKLIDRINPSTAPLAIFCQAEWDLSGVLTQQGVADKSMDDFTTAHDILGTLVSRCDDPWQSRARLLRAAEERTMDNDGVE